MDDDDDDKPGGGTLVMPPAGPGTPSDPYGHGTAVIPVVGPRDPFPQPLATAHTEHAMPALPARLVSDPHASRPSAPGAPELDWSQPQQPAAPPIGAPPWSGQAVAYPPPASPRRRGLMAIAIGAGGAVLLMGILLLIVMATRSPADSAASSTASSASAAAPSETATASAPPPPSAVASAPALTGPDAEAVAALELLRDGIALCVKNTIHQLPGTSPSVPEVIAWLKSGPYASSVRDWNAPFFNCTRFKLEKPMPFMVQWQVDVPGSKGTGIAWLDTNADGVADRAYAFTGTLKAKDVMEFGPIEATDAKRKPKKR